MIASAVPTAKPGDVCILLEPGKDELPSLRQRQLALRAILGGSLHEPVHLTCQRFELPQKLQDVLVERLRAALTRVLPFPIRAAALVQFYSPFWQLDLLRWRVQYDDQIHQVLTLVDDMLTSLRITLHYPPERVPLVTALEGIPLHLPEQHLQHMAFPQPIFVARLVILSRIKGPRDFEILGRLELQS